jgi:MFS family permease
MKITVKGKNSELTSIDIKERGVKKKEPEIVDILPESITEQRNLTMSASRIEGVLKSVKTGISTNFAAPFGLALGMSATTVSLLTAIPQLFGSFSVLFIENLIRFVRKRKKLMVAASYLESYTYLFILLMAALSINHPWLLIVLVTLDAIFINIQYPIWNSIMSDTVPNNILGRYFGIRNLLVGISSLVSVIIAGFVLNQTAKFSHPLLGFAIIFGVAFFAAYGGSGFQSKMIDPNPKIKSSSKHSFKEFIFTIKDNNFGRYTWFFTMFQMFVFISAPFYAIYMLRVLKFDYMTFTIITTASAITALLSMRIWGNLVDRYGSKKIMSITAFMIPFSPIFWILTTNWKALAGIEAVSGILWAGFNISCSTFMFESVKPEHKVKFYTYNKVLYGVGVFVGSLIGIAFINLPPVIFSSSFLLIFFVSGMSRLVTSLIFIPIIDEEKVVTINFKSGPFFKQIITLRPREAGSMIVGGSEKKFKTEKDLFVSGNSQVKRIKKNAEKVVTIPKNTSIIEKAAENQKKDKRQVVVLLNQIENEKKKQNRN